MMIFGIRFFFYSKEETRMHIHVEAQEREMKVWLDTFDVPYNDGFPDHEVNNILKLVRKNEKRLKKAWISHFG